MRNKQGRREGEVWDACDERLAENKKLTLDTLQNKLESLGYDRGSPNYIYRYRKTWLESKGMTLDDLRAVNQRVEIELHQGISNQRKSDVPKALIRNFESHVQGIQKNLRDEYDCIIKKLETDLTESKDKIDLISKTNSKHEQELQRLEKENSSLSSNEARLQTELSQKKEENKLTKQQITSQNKLMEEIKTHHSEQLEAVKRNIVGHEIRTIFREN